MSKKQTLEPINEALNTRNTIDMLNCNLAVRNGKYLYLRPKNKIKKTKNN